MYIRHDGTRGFENKDVVLSNKSADEKPLASCDLVLTQHILATLMIKSAYIRQQDCGKKGVSLSN